jgi:hypothetical protein
VYQSKIDGLYTGNTMAMQGTLPYGSWGLDPQS